MLAEKSRGSSRVHEKKERILNGVVANDVKRNDFFCSCLR